MTSVKVMVVDDDPKALRSMQAVLEPLGCEVLIAADAKEAERCLTTHKVDGIIVDAQMPGVDGFELTRSIRESRMNSRAPIVLLSEVDDAATMRKGFQAGATFFLGKPLTRERVYHLFNAARGAMIGEQRRHERFPFRTTVRCARGEEHFSLESINLSEGGMLLEPSGTMELDQEFDLEFAVPHGPKPIRARARALRKEPSDRLAVEFVSLDIEDRLALRHHLNGCADDSRASKDGSSTPHPWQEACG